MTTFASFRIFAGGLFYNWGIFVYLFLFGLLCIQFTVFIVSVNYFRTMLAALD
jgi:hypothetical protein